MTLEKIIPALLAAACAACSTTPPSPTAPVNPIFAKVQGTWGPVAKSEMSCGASPQSVVFNSDYSKATFSSGQKLFTGDKEGRKAVVYKVLSVNGNVLTMFIEGEQRKTENGDPVVWSLVLVNDKTFFWRRTDWAHGVRTPLYARCDD